MAGHRRRDLIKSRRRREEEGDEEGTWASDDSQSDASVISDLDAAADADDSELSDLERTNTEDTAHSTPKANGVAKGRKAKKGRTRQAAGTTPDKSTVKNGTTNFPVTADTEAMINGLKIGDDAVKEDVVDFESMGDETQASAGVDAPASRQETLAERRRREHEEYKKKRDSDPAFIPNRGAFFMHDHRSSAPGQNGFRPFGKGRGRGRGAVGGPFSPANLNAQATAADSSPWTHDLHDSVLDEPKPDPKSEPKPEAKHNPELHAQEPPQAPTIVSSSLGQAAPFKPPVPASNKPVPPAVRNFNTTKLVGNAQVRVFLPGMKEPIAFSGVPIKSHTRLPNHRPPLRRDKPVRISLPDHAPQYIFPHTDRSFIFIPRALRPNQQGFGRVRGRAFGSLGGFSSRRTSAYGGSVYSPSVAMSRRSSLAREMGRDGLVSPGGSVVSRPSGPGDQGRPVVRLPTGPHHSGMGTPVPTSISGSTTPVVNLPQPAYPLPQKPAFRENWSSQPLTMHQPKPQKPVSTAGFEAPFHPPQQQEQQPFSNQLPAHITNGMQNTPSAEASTFYPHNRHLSYPSQGTPLSNIPERAIHAPAFNPYAPAAFPQPFAAQPAYFYPNGTQYPVMQPIYVQNQGFVNPQATTQAAQAAQPMPVEQNGMVYYMDPQAFAAAYAGTGPENGFVPGQYAMQAVPGMGGMMTPAGSEGGTYFYQGYYQ